MASEIIMPRYDWAQTEGTIVAWLKKDKEPVKKGEIVAEVESMKTIFEVEAPDSGILHIVEKEGATVPVGKVIALIAQPGEELPSIETLASVALEQEPLAVEEPVIVHGIAREVRISPLARRLAMEHGVDVSKIRGTGPGGRIVREDIEKAIATKPAAPKEVAVPAVAAYAGRRIKTTIPLKGMRKAIAEHMHRSLAISAQLTAMGEIDMTQMVKLRQDLVAQENVIGTRISYTDLLVFAIARALKDHPVINASLIDNEIKVWEDINIGVAVALDEGLIVPVVKNADKKSLTEISKTVKSLVEKARTGKLVPDEVTGGTFTISNLGALSAGYRFETVIINQPESAILGTGAITDRAVVREGQIVIRPIMTYYFTYDHRVVDGAVTAKFMATVIKLLENPNLLFIKPD